MTNDVHLALYTAWAKDVPNCRVLSDGTTSNATRLGAVAAMQLGIEALSPTNDLAVIVAGDTILPGLDICSQLSDFVASSAPLGVFAYALRDPTDCVRRGMFRADEKGFATELVEKPASIAESPSNLASAPVYVLRRSHWGEFREFLAEKKEAPLAQRDAPGFWVRWAISRASCKLLTVAERVDIGGLAHYRDALWRFGGVTGAKRAPNEPAVGRAFPRAGLLGNPSDGYRGKTIAVALASEGFAEVIATPAEKFSVRRNEAHELPDVFANIWELSKCVERYGVHYGARQLVLAAASAFAELVTSTRSAVGDTVNGVEKIGGDFGNCQLTYSTTIPVRLGLAGSSALILATFRALARFHGTSLHQLDSDIASWPDRLHAVETDLVGIECGLQDRVAQVYQGCTFMDFSGEGCRGVYERLDETQLPQLWIGYRADFRVGEHSGKVHSTLRKRFRMGDPVVLEKMRELGNIAERGRKALCKGGDISILSELMRQNFALRLELVGKEAVGEGNLHLVETARLAGFAAKMSGSGGAIICVPDPVRSLSEDEIAVAKKQFQEAGLVLKEVEVLPRCDWSSA